MGEPGASSTCFYPLSYMCQRSSLGIYLFSLALRSIFMLYFMLHLVMNQLRAYTPGRAFPGLDNNIFSAGVEREFSMSTTTPSPRETKPEEGAVASTTGRGLQGWLLILVVFVAGSCSLAVELSASRLLAPYFGSSLFVWANLIGLILLYLTVGYYVGGRLADRSPRPGVLYTLTIIAAFLISVIPFLSRPILLWSQSAFATYSIGVFYGSLVSVILLFAIPMILLGCVSPFAIRLRIEQVGKSGRTSG